MKIAVLSDCRVPTKATGGHGLGRMAWDLANGLSNHHEVTLYAGPGSEPPFGVRFHTHPDEKHRARSLALDHIWLDQDVIIDLSHKHDLSQMIDADRPVINWIVDLECTVTPRCAVVGNAWQQRQHAAAKIVPLGIDVAAIPFISDSVFEVRDIRGNPSKDYLAFAAKIVLHKGADRALEVHARQPVPVRFVGETFDGDAKLPWHVSELTGAAFHRFLGDALALLSPCREDAGGRVNLEAAACGTPVLCLDETGTAAHVEDGVSGFICRDLDELVDAVQDCARLDRHAMRDWVRETHDIDLMVGGIERLCEAVAGGERW